jgi:hypothetical protein
MDHARSSKGERQPMEISVDEIRAADPSAGGSVLAGVAGA